MKSASAAQALGLATVHGPIGLWYLTRGTGLIALMLLSSVVVLGTAVSQGWSSKRWPRFFSQGLHGYLSLLCLALIAGHVLTTVIDGFVPIGFLDAVIPFRSPYRSFWLGLGAVGFDLFMALLVTSAVRHRIGYRNWKAIHWLAYLCWPVAVFHGLRMGTDIRLLPVLVINAICVTAVLAAVGCRLAGPRAGRRALGLTGRRSLG